MPIYEYECRDCGFRLENLESFDAVRERICPECGGNAVRSLSSGTGLVMSGGHQKGWGRGNCEQSSPCCGRESRCEHPPCESL